MLSVSPQFFPPEEDTCWLDGKFKEMKRFDKAKSKYIILWKNCDGVCIKTTEKCHGKCNLGQCESANGSCQDSSYHAPTWQNCKGKCIPKEDLCNGKCTNYNKCELNGKCVNMYDY